MRRRNTTSFECLPVSSLAAGVVVTVFFAAAAALSQVYPGIGAQGAPTGRDVRLALLFLAFAGLGASLIAGYFATRIVVETDRLYYRSFFRHGSLNWATIARARYFPKVFWFRLVTTDGRVLHLQLQARDLPRFADLLARSAPRDSLDGRTRERLDALVERPPPRTRVDASRLWETPAASRGGATFRL